MSDQIGAAAPGWYPDASGVRRYWDGSTWLDIPDPDAPADVPNGAAAPANAPARTRSRAAWISLAVIAAVVLIAGGVVAYVATRPKPPSLANAYTSCGLDKAIIGATSGATLGDGGATLVLDGKGEKDLIGLSVPQIACALAAVNTPQSVIANMSETRALDGTQSAKWDGITATWRYHPDSGLNIVLTRN